MITGGEHRYHGDGGAIKHCLSKWAVGKVMVIMVVTMAVLAVAMVAMALAAIMVLAMVMSDSLLRGAFGPWAR